MSSVRGGMEPEFHRDTHFAHQTFSFLKKALSLGEKRRVFQPRGPREFTDGDWAYQCNLDGNLQRFKGEEKILFRGKVVFAHAFNGGLFLSLNSEAYG